MSKKSRLNSLLIAHCTLLCLNPLLQAADRCSYLPNTLERSIIDQLNLVRKDPPGYAFHLEDLEASYQGTERKLSGNTYLSTQEGVTAVQEAVRALQSARPRPSFKWDPCLSASAAEHVRDTGSKGLLGHDSSNGEHFAARIRRYVKHYRASGEDISYGLETPEDVVQQLLIDDGVPDRGHRKNILDPGFNTAGAACGPHAKLGTMCVIDFARE